MVRRSKRAWILLWCSVQFVAAAALGGTIDISSAVWWMFAVGVTSAAACTSRIAGIANLE